MAKVANTDPFKNFPGWNPVEKHKNHGQNQKASHMEPFGGNLWHCVFVLNFGESRSYKTAIFAIAGALNFVFAEFQPSKCGSLLKRTKFRVPKCVKMTAFVLLDLPILI